MPATFAPRLYILPESQQRLWPELDAVPSGFVLYLATGLTLQLGHRFLDLDPADPNAWVCLTPGGRAR